MTNEMILTRHLLEMASSSTSLEDVVKRTRRSPKFIRKTAIQMGISFERCMRSVRPKRSTQGPKAKGK